MRQGCEDTKEEGKKGKSGWVTFAPLFQIPGSAPDYTAACLRCQVASRALKQTTDVVCT